ncbi:MAG: ATP-binding protein [Ferruginibacter sp.]
MPLKKVVIIGPESTGKSTLCEQLATHYNTDWVKEYAREYLLKNGTKYSFEIYSTLQKVQIEQEETSYKKQGAGNKNENPNPKSKINLSL